MHGLSLIEKFGRVWQLARRSGFSDSRLPVTANHTASTDGKEVVRQLPNKWRMADKDDLVESAKVRGASKHAHVLLGIGSIQSSHGFVPEKSPVPNAFALPHVVDGDAQVDGFVDQDKLPA